ncbi:MAG: nucleoside triphosphate pyrophosphatase [Acidimicrobiia bacterium]
MLILASASPRRRALLEPFCSFEVRPADLDESVLPGEDARRYVERLARDKARAVGAHRAPPVVLAADTTVALDGEIFAKPDDAAHAARMLAALSGRTHEVHTGVAVARAEGSESFVVTTEVTFAALTEAMIHWYVGTGEPLDKAGAYAIQGAGGAFVAAIAGSFSNVVGLPLVETLAALARAGVAVRGAAGGASSGPGRRR